jgi:DNA-binding response OmpR family regulator
MESSLRVLLVEDPSPKLEALTGALRANGYKVECANAENAALDAIVQWQPKLILLDLSTRSGLGAGFCRNVRNEHNVPIVALASAGQGAQVLAALEEGADSFVVRPLNVEELTIRMKFILRTSGAGPNEPVPVAYECGPIVIYPERRAVLVRGSKVEFQKLEYELLLVLARHPGRVRTRRELVTRLWPDRSEGPNNLKNLINRIRIKIEIDPHLPRHILTMRNVGYFLELGADGEPQGTPTADTVRP